MIGKLNGSAERLAVALRDVIADAVEPGQSKLQSQMDELRKEMADRFRQHREDVAGDMSHAPAGCICGREAHTGGDEAMTNRERPAPPPPREPRREALRRGPVTRRSTRYNSSPTPTGRRGRIRWTRRLSTPRRQQGSVARNITHSCSRHGAA